MRPPNTLWDYTYWSNIDFAISCIADASTCIHTKIPLLNETSTELDGKWRTSNLKRLLKKSAKNVNSTCQLNFSVDRSAKLKHLILNASWFCGEITSLQKWRTSNLKRLLKKSTKNVNSTCQLTSSVDRRAKLKHLFPNVSWFCGEITGDFLAKMAHSSTHKLHKRVCTRQINLGNTRCIALVNANLYQGMCRMCIIKHLKI